MKKVFEWNHNGVAYLYSRVFPTREYDDATNTTWDELLCDVNNIYRKLIGILLYYIPRVDPVSEFQVLEHPLTPIFFAYIYIYI